MSNNKRTETNEFHEQVLRQKKKDKRLVKRILITVLILLAVLGALAGIITLLQGKAESAGEEIIRQKDEVYPTLNPFPADFNTDISTLKDYTGLGISVMYEYTDGNRLDIADISAGNKNEGQKFFEEYFDILKKGDCEKYAKLFTDSYLKTPVGFEKTPDRIFPPQKVYDILVEEIMRTSGSTLEYKYENRDCDFGIYRVSYRIYKNDGYFRPDLYSENITRPLIVELVTFKDGGETLIKNIYTESSIVPDTPSEN